MVWARCVGRTLPKLPCHLAKRWSAHYLGADNSHLKDQISRRAEYGDGAGDAARDDQVQRVQTRSGMEACRGSGPMQIPARAIVLDGYLAVSLAFRHCRRHGVSNMLKHQLLCSAVRLGRSNPPKLQMLTRRLREGSSQAIGQPDGDNTGDDRRKARVVREYERI